MSRDKSSTTFALTDVSVGRRKFDVLFNNRCHQIVVMKFLQGISFDLGLEVLQTSTFHAGRSLETILKRFAWKTKGIII